METEPGMFNLLTLVLTSSSSDYPPVTLLVIKTILLKFMLTIPLQFTRTDLRQCSKDDQQFKQNLR